MKGVVLFISILAVVLGALLALALLLKLPTLWIGLALGTATLVAVIVALVLRLNALRRAARIEAALKQQAQADVASTERGGQAALAEMQSQFQRQLDALKASASGGSALADLPWYLVIGAPGSGKTTSLQESGLAFSAPGGGSVRAIRGIGGTRNCDWWFTDSAIFLDTAGRYTTEADDQPEWLAFLDLVRTTRRARALNGVVVVVSVANLLRADEAAVVATVAPIRARLTEVCRRLDVVLPVYVMFSKCDLLGGFKDYFATLGRGERDQVWGATFARADFDGRPPRDVFAVQAGRLYAALQARRVAAMSVERPLAQSVKACLFPATFSSAQRWMGEFVAELFRPLPLKDQPWFRGFYCTSGVAVNPAAIATQTIMPAAGSTSAGAVAPKALAGAEASIFFPTSAGAAIPASVDQRPGFFLKDLFARVIIPDRALAGMSSDALRRRLRLRAMAVYGSLAVGVALALLATTAFLSDHRLVAAGRAAAARLVESQRASDPAAHLDALESARAVLVDAQRLATGRTSDELARRLHAVYFPRLAQWFTTPAAARLHLDLDRLRIHEDKSPTLFQDMTDRLLAYRMLAGDLKPENGLLERMLVDRAQGPRPPWLARLPGEGRPDERHEAEARAHLAYLASHAEGTSGWQARLDKALVERIKTAIGGGPHLLQSYRDVMATVQGVLGRVDREQVLSGDHRDLLTTDVAFTAAFTRDGWESVCRRELDERCRTLADQLQSLAIRRSPDEVRRYLHSSWMRDYNQQWLGLTASVRPTPFSDLAQAAQRLRLLAGGESPYRGLARRLAEAHELEVDGSDVRNHLPAAGKWLDDGLVAVLEMQGVLERWLGETRAGERTRDLTRLTALIGELNAAAGKLTTAARSAEPEESRRAVEQLFANLLDALRAAFASELGGEQDRLWAAEVAKPFADGCAGRFPFAAEATAEVPLADLARLFSPKRGALWARSAAIDVLAGLRLGGREIVITEVDYQRLLPAARALSAALYADGTAELNAQVVMKLILREGTNDISIAVGPHKGGYYDNADNSIVLPWKAGDPGGAKISVALAGDRWLTRDWSGSVWGPLRLLLGGNPGRVGSAIELEWEFADNAPVRKLKSSAVLVQGSPFEALLAKDFFRALVIPARPTTGKPGR